MKNRLAELSSKTFLSTAELCEFCDLETASLKSGIDSGEKRWGRWKYESHGILKHSLHGYGIPLDQITTVILLGDWQLHMARKNWITAEDLGNIVLAVMDLVRVGYHRLPGAE